MTEPDLHDVDLDALFALDLPPAYDGAFVVAVAQRMARRRLMLEIANGIMMTALIALVLWAIGPVLAPVVVPALASAGLALFLAAPVVAVVAAVLVMSAPRHAV